MASIQTDPDQLAALQKAGAREALTKANLVSITNSKLAASMVALGFFDFTWQTTVDTATGGAVIDWRFHGLSTRFPAMPLAIAKQWQSGDLQKLSPMHPLCIMMHAQHNYDRLGDMQRGQPMRLVLVKGTAAQIEIYKQGPEQEAMKLRGGVEPTEDFALAAACGLVGLPVLAFDGAEGSRRYWLPALGYELRDAAGLPCVYAAADMLRRDPTKEDPLRLSLEVTSPLHAVVLGYDALYSRRCLKRLIPSRPSVLVTKSDCGKKALLMENFSGRIMDELARRFGSAPIV